MPREGQDPRLGYENVYYFQNNNNIGGFIAFSEFKLNFCTIGTSLMINSIYNIFYLNGLKLLLNFLFLQFVGQIE